jgi:hypothetical protein
LYWFDLKRWGLNVDKSALTGEVLDFKTDARILGFIPTNELDRNLLMVQNEGY